MSDTLYQSGRRFGLGDMTLPPDIIVEDDPIAPTDGEFDVETGTGDAAVPWDYSAPAMPPIDTTGASPNVAPILPDLVVTATPSATPWLLIGVAAAAVLLLRRTRAR